MRLKAYIAAMPLTFLAGLAAAAPPTKGEPWKKYDSNQSQMTWVYPVSVTGTNGTTHEASCATVGNDFANITVRYWILGFWSGMNTAKGKMVGKSTDTNGVIGEVKLYCAAHPSSLVTDAVEAVYSALQAAGK